MTVIIAGFAAALALFRPLPCVAAVPAAAAGQASSPMAKALPEDEDFKQIRQEYAQGIEPIFKQSCFNCHSRFIKYPWNYNVPFVKKKVDEDMADARERLELSDGFPLESK